MSVKDNGNFNLKTLVAAEDARFNRPQVQTTIKEPRAEYPSPPVEVIDEALNPRLSKAVRAAVAAITHVPPETVKTVASLVFDRDNLFELDLVEVRKCVAELQKGYDSAMAKALAHTPRDHALAYRAHLAACENTSLETHEVSHCDGKTLEQFELEYRQKFQSAMAIAKSYAHRARELVQPYVLSFVSRLRDMADDRAGGEQRSYQRAGIPWEPSKLLAMIYKVAEIIEQQGGSGATPAICAQFLNLSEVEN